MKPAIALLLLGSMSGAAAQTAAPVPAWSELEQWAETGTPARPVPVTHARPAGTPVPTWRELEDWVHDGVPAPLPAVATAPSPGPRQAPATPDRVFVLVWREACRAGVRPDLALSIADTESGFVYNAVSDKGAKGAMQIMPGTARAFAGPGAEDRLLEPEFNVKLGVGIIADLQRRYAHPATAAACYYAGEGFIRIRNQSTQADVLRYAREVARKMATRYRGYTCGKET